MAQSWTFGGTALTSFGIVTMLDESIDFVESRNDDVTIPFAHGRKFVQKFFDSRKISFGIAVNGGTPAGLQTKLDNLRKLLAVRTEQVLSFTLDDASVRTALASCNESLSPKFETPWIARVVVVFTLSVPFFRLTTDIADNTTAIDASPKAMVCTNPGTVEENEATIIIHGAFTSVTITNQENGASVTYTGSIGTSETVTIGVLNGEYYATLSTGSVSVIGNVTHSGAVSLLPLIAGANDLEVTSAGRDANSTIKITFKAPYL